MYLQRLGFDTVEREWRLQEDVGMELKLTVFIFHFIQSIADISLIHGTENKNYEHVWKSVEAGKYSIKISIVNILFLCLQ